MLSSVLACLVLTQFVHAGKGMELGMHDLGYSCVVALTEASVIMHIPTATSSWQTVCCHTQGAFATPVSSSIVTKTLGSKEYTKQHTHTHTHTHRQSENTKKYADRVEEGTDLLQGEVLELQ